MMYGFGALAIILAIVFIYVRCKKGGIAGLLTKTTASFAFVFLGLIGTLASGLTEISLFIILGLICGLIGDILLDLKVMEQKNYKPFLNAGIASFLIGHIFYFIATVIYANVLFAFDIKTFYIILIAIAIAVVVTLFIVLYGAKLLKLNFGEFKIQSYAYTFVLSFMTAFSIGVAFYNVIFFVFAAGITLIFASDIILSKQYFGDKKDSKLFTILNHAIYYAGQILIACSLFLI
ncbi:MAG: hypothetical protein E7378_00270 [Clostridiales bacterium]|nr:hypothetical protein [Clostridiales bacterium]